MRENTIASLRRNCLVVMGRDPMAEGRTFDEAKRELERFMEIEGKRKKVVFFSAVCDPKRW